MTKELWKSIRGYEGLYEISSFGVVKRKTVLSVFIRNGYPSIALSKNGQVKNVYIHRLVADTFILNPLRKKTVNHKDACKTNNKLSNLEWLSDHQNQQHAIANKLHKRGGKHGMAKIKEQDAIEIRRLNGLKKGKISQFSLAKRYGISQGQVSAILSRKNWKHI